MDALDLVGAAPASYVPVSMHPETFAFREEKRRLITYMPRKRRQEAALIHAELERRGRIDGYEIAAIDGVPLAAVRERLAESLIFISLLHRESLGFPAMEAMASGCIVIGYTGHGGREYFGETTGIPIEEGDTPGLVRAVEEAVAAHRDDPARLDALRRRGSERVRERYSDEKFEACLLSTWRLVEGSLQT